MQIFLVLFGESALPYGGAPNATRDQHITNE